MTDALQFEEFVRKYQDLVFSTAFRLLGDASEAEDAAQTVFLKAFERFDEIWPSPTVGGWLRTVTTNLCLSHLTRHQKRWRLFSEMSREDESDDAYEDGIAVSETPASEAERADRAEHLERALQALPEHQRVPLVLFHFEERSYEDIAVMLDVSLGKVKTDIHRGRKALRQQLQ